MEAEEIMLDTMKMYEEGCITKPEAAIKIANELLSQTDRAVDELYRWYSHMMNNAM